MKQIYFILLLLLHFHSTTIGQNKFFSKNGHAYNTFFSFYDNTIQVKDLNLDSLTKRIQLIDFKKIPKEIIVSGSNLSQVLIDEQGDLEFAIIRRPLHPLLDSLTIESLKSYSFKRQTDSDDKPVRYTFFIKNIFIESVPRYPKLVADPDFKLKKVKPITRIKSSPKYSNSDEVGALFLSNMSWDWKSYIKKMKDKLQKVWETPPAYNRLGLISGYTNVKYEINKDGTLINLEVIKHDGDIRLRESSVNAIRSLFPFLPLPKDFPDPTLTIQAKLYYPDLRRSR